MREFSAMQADDSHYTVLARRFRPQTFAEIVGQEHVGQALRNAIRANRVAHAYLFTGARGVGKTSTARIFAKALNCPHAVDGLPCNKCDVCQSIAAGSDVDVLEIDGASNRGIEDIRTLRANVTVRSMRSPYKVYIIDEVHMLTREAFNALLKTLEEPPPNVKFVFCTTEPNKVPDTILSRCQRFDFGLIGTPDVIARLRQIAEAEQVEIDDEALELIARRASGSMRDAQSLLDQLLAFGSRHLTTENVHRLLGTAPDDRLLAIAETLVRRNAADALAALENGLSAGIQLGSLSDQLLEYLRDLLVANLGADGVPLLSVSERLRPELRRQAREWGAESITASMQILTDTKSRMQRVTYGRALLELALVRICLLEKLDDLAELARELRSSPGAAPASGARTAPPARPQPVIPSPSDQPSRKSEPPTQALKKNDTRELNHPAATSVAPTDVHAPETPGVAAAPDPPVTPLEEGTLQVIWNQILEQTPEVLSQHLRNASRLAISGPNHLEIVFPVRYSFSRGYCERAESLRRLEDVARRLTGVTVRFRIDSEPVDGTPAEVSERPAPRAAPLETVRKDPFVQQVLATFGGSVVDVRSIVPSEERKGINLND